jgi:hypothetical protein
LKSPERQAHTGFDLNRLDATGVIASSMQKKEQENLFTFRCLLLIIAHHFTSFHTFQFTHNTMSRILDVSERRRRCVMNVAALYFTWVSLPQNRGRNRSHWVGSTQQT